MARVPGTERQTNRAGWEPGQVVRCRRSRANGALGLADATGFVCEVRPGHVRVLLDADGRSVWLESPAVLAHPGVDDGRLEQLRRVFSALRGTRLEFEEGGLLQVFSEEHPAAAVDEVRNALGDRLVGYEIAAHGVHEMVSRLRLIAEEDSERRD